MTDSKTTNLKGNDEVKANGFALRNHRKLVFAVYFFAFLPPWLALSETEARESLITILASGAILATFGSALCTLCSMWERDLLDRVKTNIDIFYVDIAKVEEKWRRWPFLPRSARRRQIDETFHNSTLQNPQIPIDVGSHVVTVELPTVLDDFFDLSIKSNYGKLRKNRSAASVAWTRREKEEVSPETGMTPFNEHMAFECMYDIWSSIFRFRVARYVTHFGSGLIVFSFLTAVGFAVFV